MVNRIISKLYATILFIVIELEMRKSNHAFENLKSDASEINMRAPVSIEKNCTCRYMYKGYRTGVLG